MRDAMPDDRWPMLPGPKWATAVQARNWLIEQRRLLEWSHKDLSKAFFECAGVSDLWIGTGGGALFPRATEKRLARFEREGAEIPDWMYWMPLAIQHAQVPCENRWQWARDNVPAHGTLREEREQDAYASRIFHLEDDEIAMLARFRELNSDERLFLRYIAQPQSFDALVAFFKRATKQAGNWLDALQRASS